ncbi:MAG: tetratricopeptide repeat-containing sulfotransferase family protein [Gammaproteobacteria bacterium]
MLDIKLKIARQLHQSGKLEEAKAIYTQVLAVDSDNVSALIALGEIDDQPLAFDELRRLLENAIRADPDSAQLHIQLGKLLRDNNEFDDACAAFRAAIAIDSRNAYLYDDIAIITQYDEITDDVRAMQEIYAQSSANSQTKMKLGFALGKVFDDLQQYDTAFEYFREANRIGAVQANWTNAGRAEWFQYFRKVFDEDFLARYQDIGIPDESPIFITGMMRTGSTLREQILCSHPQVYGAGETMQLNELINEISLKTGSPFPQGFNKVDPQLFKDAAIRYIEGLKSLSADTAFFTDKMNYNFFYAPLIAVMLPNAKIIYCKRDPRDQGLSYFQKDLPHNQAYCYDLAQIGEITRYMQDLMSYWQELMPGRIFVSHYEELVTEPEERIRDLLDHCGLNFDPACLSFYETKREVLNISRAQIRKPMHTKSIGRWKNYAEHLQPLISALNRD